MVSVTARKIRDHSVERSSAGMGRVYTGYLISYPIVGRGMVIFRDPHGHRMIAREAGARRAGWQNDLRRDREQRLQARDPRRPIVSDETSRRVTLPRRSACAI
jgi:hypothetical protein